ncbi:MAG: hypothetical protein ACI8ZB_004998 [Desulforhopalus sp.]|jgi:hypothetical protein
MVLVVGRTTIKTGNPYFFKSGVRLGLPYELLGIVYRCYR